MKVIHHEFEFLGADLVESLQMGSVTPLVLVRFYLCCPSKWLAR